MTTKAAQRSLCLLMDDLPVAILRPRALAARIARYDGATARQGVVP